MAQTLLERAVLLGAALEGKRPARCASAKSWERERSWSLDVWRDGRYDYFLDGHPQGNEDLQDTATSDLAAGPKAGSGDLESTSSRTGESAPAAFVPTRTHIRIDEDFHELGHRVWDTCVVMCKYLERHPDAVRRRRCLEVGAGTGLLGLVASRLGAERVVLTEYGRCVPHLVHNVDKNRLKGPAGPPSPASTGRGAEERLQTRLLDWREAEWPEVRQLRPQVILASDILVFPADVPLIVELFRRLLGECATEFRGEGGRVDRPYVLLGVAAQREPRAEFLSAAAEVFELERIERGEWHPGFVSEHSDLFRILLRDCNQGKIHQGDFAE